MTLAEADLTVPAAAARAHAATTCSTAISRCSKACAARAPGRFEDGCRELRRCARRGRRDRRGLRRQRHAAADRPARPLRPAHRRPRVPPRLAPPDGARRRARHRGRAVGRPAPGRPRRPRRALHHARPGRGRDHLPARDDLLVRARAAAQPGRRRALGAARHERASTTSARSRPPASAGALVGMALTERGGGSDVRAGTATTATPAGDGAWTVDGAKWFVSAAQSDAFFVLAQTSGGLSLVLVPRLRRRRRAQRAAVRPPQGQARQPLEPDRRGGAAPGRAAPSSARRAAASARSWR